MQFRRYVDELADIDKIIVDGNGAGCGLQLSHWPGNTTPAHLKADLSVESVLRFIADPTYPQMVRGRSIVTNDHHDTDGLLAAWAVLNPTTALLHRRALIAAAETGDFYEFTTPQALQFDLLVEAFTEPDRSPIGHELHDLNEAEIDQRVSEVLLPQLPELLYETNRYESLWREEYETLVRRLRWLNEGRVHVQEFPEMRLSTIRTPQRLDHFGHNYFSRGHRILETIEDSDGTRYILHYRQFLWYDIVSRTASPTYDMTEAANYLNQLEPPNSGGAWVTTKWTPALLFAASGPRQARTVSYKEPLGVSALSGSEVLTVVIE